MKFSEEREETKEKDHSCTLNNTENEKKIKTRTQKTPKTNEEKECNCFEERRERKKRPKKLNKIYAEKVQI